MHKSTEGSTFIRRFLIYQKERFPFVANSLYLSAFALCAMSYSRFCRGESGFVRFGYTFSAALTVVLLFFILRVIDEFKDHKSDLSRRPHLPVPRGLVSLRELRITGLLALTLALLINNLLSAFAIPLLLLPLLFLFLIATDFGVSNFLKRNWPVYVLSHMLFYPVVDLYSSSMDWYAAGLSVPPRGMLWFYAASYCNGLVYEVGRKIKSPEKEEFNSYTKMYGRNNALIVYLSILVLACFANMAAAKAIHMPVIGLICLFILFLSSFSYVVVFWIKKDLRSAKLIELGSGAWGLFTYLCLGIIPHIF